MTNDIKARLAEIKARDAACTRAPWTHNRERHPADGMAWWEVESEVGTIAFQVGEECEAEFIAHAREDVPWLVEQVERLREFASMISHRFGSCRCVNAMGRCIGCQAREALGDD